MLNFDLLKADEPSDAPTVLLSSGLGGAAGFWAPQIDALRARFNVLTYDHRGTGRNAMALPADHSIADMAADVSAIIDAAGVGPCHLVGHALGGLIGLQLALDDPGALASLTVVNGWAAPNPHSARCFAARRRLLLDSGVRAYVEAQPIFLYPPAWCVDNDAKVRAEVDHAFTHFQGEANVLRRIDALLAFDVMSRLSDVALPTLVCVSKDDVLVPWTCSTVLSQRIPGARLEAVDSGGHGYTVTTPEVFNGQLLAFLGTVGART